MKRLKSDLVDFVLHSTEKNQKKKAEPVQIQLFRNRKKINYFLVASTMPLK